jgi:hypothetical protein
MGTPDDVRDDALETLAEWMPGWTCPESGPQSRVRTVTSDDDSITFEYETEGATVAYRIRIEVEEDI